MSFKSVFERNPICILDKRHRREHWESSNGLFDWLKQIVQPYTSRSTKFSGKINDQEATFVFVFATDSILVHGVFIMFFFIAIDIQL